MIKKMKSKIRKFAVWLDHTTEKWVLSDGLFTKLDRGELAEARIIIDKAHIEWSNDPYVSYAEGILGLLSHD